MTKSIIEMLDLGHISVVGLRGCRMTKSIATAELEHLSVTGRSELQSNEIKHGSDRFKP